MSDQSSKPEKQERRFQRRALPPGRREEDHDVLYEELEKGFRKLTDRLSSFVAKALIGFAVLGVSCAIALLGFGLVLKAFQHQRYNVFVTNCQDSNQHNLDVNAEIDKSIAKLPRKQRSLAKKNSEPVRVIIAAAFPYRADCNKYARARMRGDRG